MTSHRMERWHRLPVTDTIWTLLRLLSFVGLGFWISLKLALSLPKDEEFQGLSRMLEFSQLAFLVLGTGVWSLSQVASRSPIARSEKKNWLTMHGWDGEYRTSPARSQVPLIEWIGLLSITLWAIVISPSCCGLTMLAWAVSRMGVVACQAGIQYLRMPVFVILTLLTSASIASMGYPWVSLPIAALLIAYVLRAERKILVCVANDSLMADWQQTATIERRPRQGSSPGKLVIFAELSPDVRDIRLPWRDSVLFSASLTLLMYCVLFQIHESLPNPLDETRLQEAQLITILLIAIAGTTMRVLLWTGGVWLPRMGPLSRLLSWRWIVVSYDVVLKPFFLSLALLALTALIPGWSSPECVSITFFATLLIFLRCGPPKDQWQMTADARLSMVLQGK